MNNTESYHKLTECGHTGIWMPEMEFLPVDKMEYRRELWSDQLYIDDMTVFAVDGGGNLYAWRDDDSVVYIDTGAGTSREFAPSLADAIFRRIVEFANGDYTDICSDEEKADMSPDDAEYYTSEHEAVELLKQYNSTFGCYFGADRREYIDSLIERGFLPDMNAFITEEELIQVIHERIKAGDTITDICR